MLKEIVRDLKIKNQENLEIGVSLVLTHYDKIKNLRPYKDSLNLEKWEEVILKIVDGLKVSKDLNLVGWLIEALSYRYNFLGFYEGLKVLEELVTTFPEFYPKDLTKQQETMGWIRENFGFWLKEEELLPRVSFRQIHQLIQMEKMDNKIVEGLAMEEKALEEYVKNKEKTREEIKTLVNKWSNPLLIQLKKQILSFLLKLDIFYKNLLLAHKSLRSQSKTEGAENSKEEIFQKITDLVNKGLEKDSHDLILYMLSKILILRSKNNNGVILKVLRENSIEGLFSI